MLGKTKTAIAASTVGLGAMIGPAAAQSTDAPEDFHYQVPEYDPNAPQATSNNPSGPGLPCGAMVIGGGVLAAGVYSAAKRNSQGEEDSLHAHRKDMQDWEQRRGGANRYNYQNKRR